VKAISLRTPFPIRLARVFARWPAFLPLILMVVSDYKFRQRSIDDSLGGRPDITVILEVIVYLAVGAYLFSEYVQRSRRVRVSAGLLALWGWGVTMFISAIISPFPVLATVRGSQLVVMCLLASMVSAVATRQDMLDLAHSFLVIVVASVGVGLVLRFPAVTVNTAGRFTWLFVHPVISGAYLGLALVLATALAMRQSAGARWSRGVYIGLAVVYAGALLKNETRGSIAGAFAGLVVVVLVSAPRRVRPQRVAALAAGVVFFALAALPEIIKYLARGESTAKLATLNSRTDLWSQAFILFKQHPLTGWGIGATRGLFLQTIGLGGGHNAFVNVLVDGGVVGLVWWLTLLICLTVAITRLGRVTAWRPELPMLSGLFAMLIVNSFTIEGIGSAANVSCMWLILLLGWTMAARRPDSAWLRTDTVIDLVREETRPDTWEPVR
jgi:exopolysaccharide production protein ExoQ